MVFSCVPSTRMTLESFLRSWFRALDQALVPWAVMRDHEYLPYRKTNRDIDILINHSDWRLALSLALSQKEVSLFFVWERPYVVSFTLLGVSDEPLIIDLVSSLCVLGVPLIDTSAILNDAVRNPEGISCLSPSDSSLIKILTALLHEGRLKDKYFEEARHVIQNDSAHIRHRLEDSFTEELLRALLNSNISTPEKMTSILARISQGLRAYVFKKSLKRAPLKTTYQCLLHYRTEIEMRLLRRDAILVEIQSSTPNEGEILARKMMEHTRVFFRSVSFSTAHQPCDKDFPGTGLNFFPNPIGNWRRLRRDGIRNSSLHLRVQGGGLRANQWPSSQFRGWFDVPDIVISLEGAAPESNGERLAAGQPFYLFADQTISLETSDEPSAFSEFKDIFLERCRLCAVAKNQKILALNTGTISS